MVFYFCSGGEDGDGEVEVRRDDLQGGDEASLQDVSAARGGEERGGEEDSIIAVALLRVIFRCFANLLCGLCSLARS